MTAKNKKTNAPFITALSGIAALSTVTATSVEAATLFAMPTLNTYANISAQIGFQKSDTLVPEFQTLNTLGSGGLFIDRRSQLRAEVFFNDPGQLLQATDANGNLLFNSDGSPVPVAARDASGNLIIDNSGQVQFLRSAPQIEEFLGIAEAPREGDFAAQVLLETTDGEIFELAISPDSGSLPAIVETETSFEHSINVSTGFDFTTGDYRFGGAVNFAVEDLENDAAEISSAFLVAQSAKYGAIRIGRGLSLPIGIRSPEVVAGQSFSFADFGDWQVSYVSPVWQGFQAGVLAGKSEAGEISLAGSAQYQYTFGNNQLRVGGYADTAKSWQGVAGYTRRFGANTFAGVSVRGGRDGGLEGFASIEATLEYKQHFLSAGFQRAWSNSLSLSYLNNNRPFFAVSILDNTLFNREDQYSLGYNYTYNRNLQFYANAEYARHKYFPSRTDFGAGVRIAF